jgi:DNA-binding IclR family transcriptional regulator
MKKSKKYPAPALEYGIRAIQALEDIGEMSLEDLTRKTAVPRSTLLRVLATMEELGMVARDNDNRKFTAVMRLVPTDDHEEQNLRILRKTMENLCDAVKQTIEWYEATSEDALTITHRCEPTGDREVRISAKVGFTRSCNEEFEAVARVACSGQFCPVKFEGRWQYDNDGNKQIFTVEEVEILLRAVKMEGAAIDYSYNSNGVRRCASGVFDQDGDPVGILAIAESFYPGADREWGQKFTVLRDSSRQLSGISTRSSEQ